jgi:tRNA_anti-like
MNRTLKIIIITIATIAVLLAGAYLYIRFMPEKSVSKQPTDFAMTATALAGEYEANTEASNKKFIDRVIEVSGTISEISTDENNSTVFILRNAETSTGVLCTLAGSPKNASKYNVGSNVKIKGTCTGMLFEVVLNKCVIID